MPSGLDGRFRVTGEFPDPGDDPEGGAAEVEVSGTVKRFDATRGFGFLGGDAGEGDALIHFSVPVSYTTLRAPTTPCPRVCRLMFGYQHS
ncbi:hypothetical protein DD897_16035, partial [Staphylococcus pseudintermedius]